MKHQKFTFHPGEKKLYMVPDALWQRGQSRKIRLLLSGERMVLLTRESGFHLLAVAFLAVIAVGIMIFLLHVLHLHNAALPLILVVVFAIGGNIHLQYRFRNPLLHRMIREIPLSQIVEAKKVSDVRLTVSCSGGRQFVFIMTPGELRQFLSACEKCRIPNS